MNDLVLRPRNGISLCSGGGGLELGIQLAEPSFACRCFVEADADAQAVLVGGMVPDVLDRLSADLAAFDLPDGADPVSGDTPYPGRYARPFDEAAVWSDVRTFVGDAWRGHVDLVSAGYPCQPFSAAGKRGGSDDPRHLWPDVARIYWETGAEWGVFENVAGHLSLGLETVLRDIWDMGATPAVGLFSSGETGGSHERQRVFIVAQRPNHGRQERNPWENRLSKPDSERRFLANSDGGDTGPEREQRGREQRFQQESRGFGETDVADASDDRDSRGMDGRTDRSAASRGESGHESEGQAPHGQRFRGKSGGSGDDVGHPSGIGRGERRAEPELRSGRYATASTDSQLADASQPGLQGNLTGRIDTQGREIEAGLSGLRSGAGLLSPPGPGETAAWGHILTLAPDLAPSLAFRDLISRAHDLAAMVAEGRVAETQAQRDLRRMADAMAARPRLLRMFGNGVDPLVAGYAWRTLSAAHGLRPLDLAATRYQLSAGTYSGEFV